MLSPNPFEEKMDFVSPASLESPVFEPNIDPLIDVLVDIKNHNSTY